MMQYLTKSADLSRHALTKHHGRLLQESGFTKLGSLPRSYENSEPTTTNRLAESFYQSVMNLAQQYSGRPETRVSLLVAPSTFQALCRASLSTYPTFREVLANMEEKLSSLKTFCPPSRSDAVERLRDTLLWGQPLDSTPLLDCSVLDSLRYSHGTTPTGRGSERGRKLQEVYHLSASNRFTSLQPKTRSTTASET